MKRLMALFLFLLSTVYCSWKSFEYGQQSQFHFGPLGNMPYVATVNNSNWQPSSSFLNQLHASHMFSTFALLTLLAFLVTLSILVSFIRSALIQKP